MRKVLIISTGVVEADRLSALDQSPNCRTPTLNMKMVHLAVQQALEPLASMKDAFKEDMAVFMGTSHGEFNSTLDFLKSWAQQKLARPFVFQNSLHNSTTGFVGLSEGYKAPLVTSSHHYFSGEDALDLASQFIKTNETDVAMVIGVDVRAGDYLPHMKGAGFPTAEWGQGSGCVILASDGYAKKNNLPVLGELENIEIKPELGRPVYVEEPDFDLHEFYDSHAVEVLAKAVRSGNRQIEMPKPNGGIGRITWSAI
jgi:3-oxoacyl-(acyl-carrier-protein) synthase